MRGDLFNITGRHPGQSPLNTHRGRGRSQWRWHSPAKYMAHSGQRDYNCIMQSYLNATLNGVHGNLLHDVHRS